MSLSFFDRERTALVRLTEAIRARTASEAELAATLQTASEKAEREVNRARKLNATNRETELAALDAAHGVAVREIAGRIDADIFAINRAREEKRSATVQRFKSAEEKGQAEYKDRIWSFDSILEGGEKKAKDQMDSLFRKAAAGEQRVEELWKSADQPLARGKLTRGDVAGTRVYSIEPSDDDPITRMQKDIAAAEASLGRLQGLFFPKLVNVGGLLSCNFLMAGVGASGFAFLGFEQAIATTVTGFILGTGLWFFFKSKALKATLAAGNELGEKLDNAHTRCVYLYVFAKHEYDEEHERITEKHARKRRETDEYYLPLLASQKRHYEDELGKIVEEHESATDAATRRNESESHSETAGYRSRRSAAESRLDKELNAAESAFADKLATATAVRDDAWNRLAHDWRTETCEVKDEFLTLRSEGERLFPEWDRVVAPLPTVVPAGVRLGDFSVDLASLPDGIPADERLAPPPELAGLVPAFAPFPDKCSVVFRARDEGRAAGVAALQAAMLRFLTGLPPGKVRFTIIDPVGLGDNFAAFMHLADFDEKLVTGQIWTEPRQIEQRLTDLTDHIASVIQKYLRNQYKTIEDYNRAAGEVAEPYRVLVIANFPTNFSPDAAKRLVSIVNSGPSCGVCTLVSVDTKLTMPRDFTLADLEAPSFSLNWRDGRFTPKDAALAPFPLSLDPTPDPATIAKLVQRVGQASKDSVRVEVPFDYIAPKPGEVWTSSASKGFDVPVGRAGATRRQVFSLGRGTAQHALIAGKTGSGKSTLLHALITNLAMMYSPDEAELYLVDFKEGVEFQWYATYRLPHARVVAIQSEREFGLSVLQRLDAILRERGEKFRDAGCNDLAGYRTATPQLKTPRILLVVDEFQQFFTEDDKLAQEAALLLDRLVRQGRAFGLHVLLGSQTLGGAYSLARSTIDQMAVRVALQCSDADAQMILSKDNTAARLLSRPGEAIYNDQNGLVEGNDPFQVVWLSEEKREDVLRELGERAAGKYPPPLVFEGNSAADPARNPALVRALEAKSWAADVKAPLAWLGDPVAIKEPTVAAFRAQGGSNLLLLGQNEEAARGLFAAALLGLAGQLRPNLTPQPPSLRGKGEYELTPPSFLGQGVGGLGSSFTLLDGTPDDAEDAEYLRKLAERLPHQTACPARSELPAALAGLAAEVERRQKGETADRSARFLFVFGIHRFRELRKAEDDFGLGRRGAEREVSPAERFAAILKEGPPLGIHVVVWCDSLTNVNRSFDRPLMREFGLRVLFQMSPTDSSTLMDSPAASKLGRNRALFLLEEQERPEKFRPYGLPSSEWLDAAIDRLQTRLGLKEPVTSG